MISQILEAKKKVYKDESIQVIRPGRPVKLFFPHKFRVKDDTFPSAKCYIEIPCFKQALPLLLTLNK
jgi:hypothetical protein